MYFVGLEISYTLWTDIRSFRFFLGRTTNPPPCPLSARTRMDQGVLSRSKVDIASKFSCFLVLGHFLVSSHSLVTLAFSGGMTHPPAGQGCDLGPNPEVAKIRLERGRHDKVVKTLKRLVAKKTI